MTEWLAYYRIEPFGASVDDQRHGIACSLLANVNRDAKKRSDPFQPKDFIPWHEANREESGAVLLADPKAQSELIKQALFGKFT